MRAAWSAVLSNGKATAWGEPGPARALATGRVPGLLPRSSRAQAGSRQHVPDPCLGSALEYKDRCPPGDMGKQDPSAHWLAPTWSQLQVTKRACGVLLMWGV